MLHFFHRQSEPHAHAIVLDPLKGNIAYVPDLGCDCIMQYVYNKETGALTSANSITLPKENAPHGPRYLEFHPVLPVGGCVDVVCE